MRYIERFQPLLLALVMALPVMIGEAARSEVTQTSYDHRPVTKAGKKWRIAYYQGGPWSDYYSSLEATVQGLIDLGWIEPVELPASGVRDTRVLWDWLVQNVESDFVEFVGDAYYTANWSEEVRTATRRGIIERLNKDKDVDLMMAMGTWAGLDLAKGPLSPSQGASGAP